MKYTLSLVFLCLLTGMQAFSQTPIVTMAISNESVTIYVEWAGSGSIITNGVELKSGLEIANTIFPASDGSIVLTATGDVQLTHLHCYDNSLIALDISNCPKLEYLYCSYNSLTVLNVTNCPVLVELFCDHNSLYALNITNCPELVELGCEHNSLTALDITNCPKLRSLYADYQTIALPVAKIDDVKLSIKNPITFTGAKVSIDNISDSGTYTGDSIAWERERESGRVTFDFTSKLPKGVNGAPFSGTATLPWTKNKPSENIQVLAQASIVTMTTVNDSVEIYVEWTGSGSLTANGVELNNNCHIENIIFPTIDGLVVLSASGDAQLTHLYCYDNSLTDLDVTKCSTLTILSCSKNSLTGLDVTNCPELEYLICFHNFLPALDITNCPKLKGLNCIINSLTALDVANCPDLEVLNCDYNPLTALDVANCQKLTELTCGNLFLTALDVTNCPKLEYLDAKDQTLKLPVAVSSSAELRIENPVTFVGAKVSIENISHNGMYINSAIIWAVLSESGEVTFDFATELPNGLVGRPFSGTATQTWIKK